MADPLYTVALRMAPVFAHVAGASEDDGIDPVVRPSDHADAQVNGALSLAKRLNEKPRDLAVRMMEHASEVGALADVVEQQAKRAAALTTGWANIPDEKGGLLEFSEKAAYEIYIKYDDIRSQVINFIDDRANFIKS